MPLPHFPGNISNSIQRRRRNKRKKSIEKIFSKKSDK
jgi:hypothetical protein